MSVRLGEQMKRWVDEVAKKNRDLEEQVENLQAKIHDLEEQIKTLKSVMRGRKKDYVPDFNRTRVLLEQENKELRLEQLERTVKYQMQQMWKMINLELEGNITKPPSSKQQRKQRQIEFDSGLTNQQEQPVSTVIPPQAVPAETNPLEIEQILDKIFGSLPLSCLFQCRRVCKLWNNTVVPKINRYRNNTRLLKIVVPLEGGGIIPGEENLRVKVVDVNDILPTMAAGRLEYSTCTNIYFNDSMEFNPRAFDTLLALNWKHIKVLHFDGVKMSEVNKVLKICAQNLECLSLWRDGQQSNSGSANGLYENDEESKLIFPKLQSITFVSGEDGNRYMRVWPKTEINSFCTGTGRSNPSRRFLIDILEASPKLHSLSCRLYGSSILEALAQTNSYSKLTTLCLKSKVGIPQLRSLISSKMRLKNLHLEGLCVTIRTHYYDSQYPDNICRWLDSNSSDPELMEFGPLLLEFLKSQANTLEYLKLDLFTERNHYHPNIPTDVLLNNFPRMPNLITFIVGRVIASRADFPFRMSTLAEFFPKLRNLQNIPFRDIFDDEDYEGDIDDLGAVGEGSDSSEDFPANYPVSQNASFALTNIRNLDISPDLAQFFPFITELHLNGNIGILYRISFCLPRLKHLYHAVKIENYVEDKVLKLIRILNGFMTGISPEECQRTEEERETHYGIGHLNEVQFARSRPSIFNLNDLETLDFKFSCYEFTSACRSRVGILTAVEVLISWGLSRMKHLKKLRCQFEQRVNSGNRLVESRGTLLKAFENNLGAHSRGYSNSGSPKDIRVERNWNFELNLKHHTSEWDQFKFFCEDPDIWDLGLIENDI